MMAIQFVGLDLSRLDIVEWIEVSSRLSVDNL